MQAKGFFIYNSRYTYVTIRAFQDRAGAKAVLSWRILPSLPSWTNSMPKSNPNSKLRTRNIIAIGGWSHSSDAEWQRLSQMRNSQKKISIVINT